MELDITEDHFGVYFCVFPVLYTLLFTYMPFTFQASAYNWLQYCVYKVTCVIIPVPPLFHIPNMPPLLQFGFLFLFLLCWLLAFCFFNYSSFET